MSFPEFFADIPGITVYDPLAELLGAPANGLLSYSFADAVRLAGHACPTVAGAWLTTCHSLRALYGSETPVRGDITVSFPDHLEEGVTGVIASVVGLITGAAGPGGFKGLGSRYGRRNLLSFGIRGVSGIRFSRRDNGACVEGILRLHAVPADHRLGPLLPAVISGAATPEQRALFQQLWQDRVRRILIDQSNDPALIEARPSASDAHQAD